MGRRRVRGAQRRPAVRRDEGLDPDLLPKIGARARHHRLRTSVHIASAADFHHAAAAGVDEIVHSASPSPFNTIRSAAQPDLFNDPAALGTLFIAALRAPEARRWERVDTVAALARVSLFWHANAGQPSALPRASAMALAKHSVRVAPG